MTMGILHLIRSWRARWQPVSAVLHAPPHAPGDAAAVASGVNAVAQWALTHPGVRLELGLSSRWLLCAVTPQARDPQAALAVAREQWSHYLGLDEQALADEWVCLPVVGSQASLVCAAPRALIDGLLDVAAQHRVQLVAVLPWWAFGLQRQLSSSGEASDVDVTGPRRWAWLEPGWCLNVDAQPVSTGGSGWCLERAWMDGGDGAEVGGVQVVAELPAPSCDPSPQAEAGGSVPSLLWLAPAASVLLKGDAP